MPPFMYDRTITFRLVPGDRDMVILMPNRAAETNGRVFRRVVERIHPATRVEAVRRQDLNIGADHELPTAKHHLPKRHVAVGRVVEEIGCLLKSG